MWTRWCASLHVCEANASYELCECFISPQAMLHLKIHGFRLGSFAYANVFWIKSRKTKQKVVALVATAFKTLFSVSKTNVGFPGRQHDAGYIDDLFWNSFTHIISPISIKKVRNRSYAPKNVAPCCDANFFTLPYNTEKHTKREHTFLPKKEKGILIPC